MYKQCSDTSRLVALFYLCCIAVQQDYFSCHATVLSKGRITMCVRDKESDPFNVVDGKRCEKKLVVTKAVSAGQGESEMIYVNVTTVQDDLTQEPARLYNPFVITISSSPMHIIYPYTLKGTVNNKPSEESILRYFCMDGMSELDNPTDCPTYLDRTTGMVIWDSQGFCCRCTFREDDTRPGEGSKRYHRGNTLCGHFHHIPILMYIFGSHTRHSAHCMVYNKLWYNVHEIQPYKIWFKIFIKAYDVVEIEKNGKRYKKLIDGGQIELSNFKTSGHGVHGRLLASIVGMFETDTQIHSLTERYLFIPAARSRINWRKHEQTKNGARDFLIIPRTFVAMDNVFESCNKIGVSFTAFRQQGGYDGQGTGCNRAMGSCLHNQVKDFFEIDVENRKQGKKPLYFPERYGDVIGIGEYDPKRKGEYALIYKAGKTGNIMISLEISADDITLVYNKASGLIVKAFATDFESLSLDGQLHIIVQNTGLVTADFYVTMKYCTRGIQRSPEVKATINAQTMHTFTFQLRTTTHESGRFTCILNLWDSRHDLLDSANVTFKTTTSCVCLQSCTCACITDNEKDVCIKDVTQEEVTERDLQNIFLVAKTRNALERFFIWLNNSLSSFVEIFKTYSLSNFISLCVMLFLLFGLIKARLGMLPGGGPIAYYGWWWDQPCGQKIFIDSNGNRITGMYNRDGDLINPSTGEVLQSEKLALFVGNVFFFFLLIFIMGVHAARYYEDWLEQNTTAVSLSSVALAGTAVYRNFSKCKESKKILTNPGEKFSLVGKVEHVQDDYRFIVVTPMQFVEFINEEMLLLTPAISFDPGPFNQTFTEENALQELTLEPQYVCLNEEPEFEFYSQEDNDVIQNVPAYVTTTMSADTLPSSASTSYKQLGYKAPITIND